MEKLKVDFTNGIQHSLEIYIEKTKSAGITFNKDTEESIYAHIDIASNFCHWLSPEFQVYFLKALKELN